MEESEEKYVHPFFSPKPALPKWRDIPWIVFVLGAAYGFQYTSLGKVEMSDRGAGLLILGVGIATIVGAWMILRITHRIFPHQRNTDP